MARATPQYKNRAKYNIVVTNAGGTPIEQPLGPGGFFKIDQFYAEVFNADTTNILYNNDGTSKVLNYDTIATIINNQFFFNKQRAIIAFFRTALTGECLRKGNEIVARSNRLYDSLMDPLMDSTNENLYDNT